MKSPVSFWSRFNAYQRERFPVLLVIGSLFLPILSSAAVVGNFHAIGIITCLVITFLYLVLIRITDELRDYEHDLIFHPERPVSSGVVSTAELSRIGIVASILFLALSATAGIASLVMAGVLLVYTYSAGKEFFLAHIIRQRFFIYNAVNLVQMVLMQVYVYVLLGNLLISELIIAHLLFTTVGTLTFELLRKLKRPGEDGAGRDTYTWYLGFGRALGTYLILTVLTAVTFGTVAFLMQGVFPTLIALGIVLVAGGAAWKHYRVRSVSSEVLLQAAYAGMYGIGNALIVLYAFI